MFKQLKERWEAYAGPKDERLAAMELRIDARLARALVVISLVSVYYDNALRRAAGMFGDSSLGSSYMGALSPSTLLCAGIIISCTWASVSMTRNGAVGANRFAETDAFPIGYFALCSAIGAALVFVGMFAVESFAQAQFAGVAGVYWAANAAMATFTAGFVFCGCVLAFYLYFLRAKRNRARIQAEFED